MSAKKSFETKTFEDENQDSGICSGPLSEEQLLSSDNLEDDTDYRKDNTKQQDSNKKIVSESNELDSGVDLCVTERLSDVKLSEGPLIVIESEKTDIPPPDVLFLDDEDGDTQIHIAAVHGCEKSVGILIRVCPDKSWLDLPNNFGHTALHLAVMCGHAVITRMLVRAGASLEARDFTGDTPLHKAVAGNKLECLQALLAPVPEHLPRKISTVLNQKNYKGQMCVHLAATSGHIEALQMLQYYGADFNAREGLAGWTALHIAARRRDARTAQWLLEHGVQRTVRDYAGRLPKRFLATDSSEESDTDEDEYDSDSDAESLFERLRQNVNPINVA